MLCMVNHGTMDEQLAIQPMKLNPEVAQNQMQRLNELPMEGKQPRL